MNAPENQLAQPAGGRLPITIMDTTLRDGEQTHGVSINGFEKLQIAKRLLTEVKVDRVEVASCRVSAGEQVSLTGIMDWARKNGYGDAVEVLSFVDNTASVEWLTAAGCSRMNLLTKGSLHHCEKQLRKTPAQHYDDVERTVNYAHSKGVKTSIYLEDWSNGIKHSPQYVWDMIERLAKMPVERIHLCDTLGTMSINDVHQFVGESVRRYPALLFEFHGHNDYGLGTANALTAAMCGVAGLHLTVNGLGERAGNPSLAEVIVCLRDHTNRATNIDESKLKEISKLVEAFSGKRIAGNTPITGSDVYTQTAGIHADGDRKGNLYESLLSPARFGRDRVYALGKLAGRSSLDFNLDKLGLELNNEQRKALLEKIVELGDKKKTVTTEDLPFLISDHLNSPQDAAFRVDECIISSSVSMKPSANIRIVCNGQEYEAVATGGGGYDAANIAFLALKQAGSDPAKVRDILKAAGAPLHVMELLARLGKALTPENRATLTGTLGNYVRKNRVFVKTAPNTFGLLNASLEEADEIPESFGTPEADKPSPAKAEQVQPSSDELEEDVPF